jgi:hypothetical protein
MEIQNNPAGRLYDILVELQKHQPRIPFRIVLAKVFLIDENDLYNLLKIVFELLVLVKASKEAIKQLQGLNHELYLGPYNKFEKEFGKVNLESNWSNIHQYLDKNTLHLIKIGSDLLNKEKPEKKVDGLDVKALHDEINELIEKIIKSDFDKEFKDLLLENLNQLLSAILLYRIKGINAFKEALEKCIGSYVVNNKEFEEAKKDENQKNIVQSIFDIFQKFCVIVSTAKGVNEIINSVCFLLPGSTF